MQGVVLAGGPGSTAAGGLGVRSEAPLWISAERGKGDRVFPCRLALPGQVSVPGQSPPPAGGKAANPSPHSKPAGGGYSQGRRLPACPRPLAAGPTARHSLPRRRRQLPRRLPPLRRPLTARPRRGMFVGCSEGDTAESMGDCNWGGRKVTVT